MGHLDEPGILEDLPGTDVHLTPGDLLARNGDHRVGLQGAGASFTGEGDRGSGERVNLRRVLVDQIEHYLRHTGHADLFREAVDGLVGEDPPQP